jgi:Ca2+-binding EF-hand superfamily protein
MTNHLTKLTGTAALLAALAAAPVTAQEASDMDTDGDASVSEEEFTAGYMSGGDGDPTMGMDTDQSGSVSEEEFAEGMSSASDMTGNPDWTEQDFAEADTDQSGDLSPEEISGVIFLIYDADQSGDLSEDEVSAYSEQRRTMEEGGGESN